MQILSFTKKAMALVLLASGAAVSMPTAAAGEGETTTGSITVGVVITEEQCDGTASIEIAQQDNATGRLELEFQEAQAPNQDRTLFQHISDSIRYPWELVVMDIERINESFQLTMVGNLEIEDLFAMTSIQYATQDEITNSIIQIHPADLNGDGFIDLVDDVHPVSRETSYLYKSDPFVLTYDAGSCDSMPVLGAVDVTRTALINENSGTDAELDLYGPVPEGAKGVAFLSKEEGSGTPYLPDFHAVMPGNGNVPFIDHVSFGAEGAENFYVELALVGEFLVGNYQTQFTFNLETNTADYWENVPAFCRILNPDWFDDNLCVGP